MDLLQDTIHWDVGRSSLDIRPTHGSWAPGIPKSRGRFLNMKITKFRDRLPPSASVLLTGQRRHVWAPGPDFSLADRNKNDFRIRSKNITTISLVAATSVGKAV